MPSFQWSYPYGAADTATVLFSASPADSSYQWVLPYRDVPAPRQTMIETVDGGVRVYNFGIEGREIDLRFTDLPAGSAGTPTALYGYLGLKYFLQSVVNWGELPLGYYDEAGGAEVKVRYIDGIKSFEQGVGGPRAGVIRLRKELV